MEFKTLVIIIIVGMYLLTLLIAGMLATLYHYKHKPYVMINKAFQQEVQSAYKNYDFNSELTPLEHLFATKADESIYWSEQCLVDIGEKTKKQIRHSFKDLHNNYYGVLQNNYRLRSKNEKEVFQTHTIYLSNRRIVFENAQQFITIKLVDVLLCQFVILYYNHDYHKILLLETKEQRCKIVLKNIQLGLLMLRFINKG